MIKNIKNRMQKLKKIILIIIIIVLIFGGGFYIGQKDYFKIQLNNQKNINQDEKLTPKDLKKVINLWEKIDEKFVDTREDQNEKITKQDHLWGMMHGLTASFRDPYTNFLPPEINESFRDDIKGEFSGVGMEITNKDGYLVVISPLPDTPAYQAGVKAKDVIIEIDGKDSLEMSSRNAVKLIRGERGTKVKIKVLRKGLTEPKEIEIIRDIIKIPVVKTFQENDVFIIKIYNFTENSPEKFVEAIKEFIKSKKNKLIIDVRGNPGGHLFAVTYILGLFLEKDKIILTEDYAGKKDDKILKSGDYHQGDKLINIFNDNLKLGILVDAGSASASEILTGVLLDYQKAIIFGKTTFGKGTVQELLPLDDKTALKVTVAKWILPKGSWISHQGITPDVEIEISEEEVKENLKKGTFSEKIDSQLKTAIEYLSKIKTKKEYQKKIIEFQEKRKLILEKNKKNKMEEIKNKLEKVK